MGTRNLTIVIFNDEIKVSQYCQWDGYPSGQGQQIAEFLIVNSNDNFQHFKTMLKNVTTATQDEIHALWTEIGSTDGWCTLEQSNKMKETYPQFQRDLGAGILHLINAGEVKKVDLQTSFAADSVFCEYAYVIDLDNEVLEVYRGFNKKALTSKDRFYFLQSLTKGEYYPLKLWKKIPFSELTMYTMDELRKKDK